MTFISVLYIDLDLEVFDEDIVPNIPYGFYVLEETLYQVLICIDSLIVNKYMKIEI